MTMSLRQLSSGVFGNLATSCWFLPMGANFFHWARGVRMREPFTVYFARDVLIDNRFPEKISIGPNSIFGPRSVVIAHASIPRGNAVVTSSDEIVKPVLIGKSVFVGANAVILPGAVIGDGCFVAAGSIVSGTFLPNTLIAGNPATSKRTL